MIRRFLLTVAGGLMLCIAAFALFVAMLPSAQTPEETTDAIIVLTGGNSRVEQGLIALAEGKAPVLFISGVGSNVTLQEMIAAHSTREVQAEISRRKPRIVLDHLANSTQSNAAEAAAFVAKYNIRSIRLVTAHYHMPRSLMEFRAAMPEVKIVPQPVVPEGFEDNGWWRDATARRIMLSEFTKTIGACLRQLVL